MESITTTAKKSSATESQIVPWADKQPRLAELCASLAVRILLYGGAPSVDTYALIRLSNVRVADDGGASIRKTIFDIITHYVLTHRDYALSDEILSILSAERR